MRRVTGSEVWRISRYCGFCRAPTSPGETYVHVGGDLFHEQCFEKLLSMPEAEFRKNAGRFTLAARQELEELRRGRGGAAVEAKREPEAPAGESGGREAEARVVWVEPEPPGFKVEALPLEVGRSELGERGKARIVWVESERPGVPLEEAEEEAGEETG